MEIWKDIQGFEGLYQVSDHGRVKALERPINHTFGGKSILKERILKLNTHSEGYKCISLRKNGILKTFKVHRLVSIAFIPNPENKCSVNHINGIKSDNIVKNLEWCTRKENMVHAVKTGLHVALSGENHGGSKLNEDQVREIKYGLTDLSQRVIAKMFNITQAQVSLIRTNQKWKHI